MLKLIRAHALTAALLSFVLLAVLIAPGLINYGMQSRLDFRKIRQQSSQLVLQKTGLRLTIQGAHYDLFRGIVLNGARLYNEPPGQERQYLMQAESVHLRFSILAYLRGEPPVSKIVINGGRLLPGAFGPAQWRSLINRIVSDVNGSSAAAPPQELFANDASLSADDLRLNLAELRLPLRDPPRGEYLSIQLEAAPLDDGLRFKAQVKLVGGEGGGIELRGAWQRDGSARTLVEFHQTPLRMAAALAAGTPLVPLALTESSSAILLAGGALNGTGSIDFYRDRAAGFNVQGQYRDLSLRLGDPAFRLIELQRGEGDINWNGGFDAEDARRSYSTLRLEQPGARLLIESRPLTASSPRSAPLSDTRIDAELEFGDGRDLPAFSGADGGRASVNLRYSDIAGEDLSGSVKLQALRFALPESVQSDTLDAHFTVHECELIRSARDERWKLVAHGGFLGAAWQTAGDLRLRIRRTPGQSPGFSLDQDLKLHGKLQSLSLLDAAELAARSGEAILHSGISAESSKAEDRGPLWQNKFFETGVYRAYLENLKLEAVLDWIHPGEGLPELVPVQIAMRQGFFSVRIPQIQAERAQLQLRYETNFQSYIPTQAIEFRLHSAAPALSLERFTGQSDVPADYDVSFAFSGEGVFPGDLVQRSYSRLSLQCSPFSIDRGQRLELLRHALNLPDGPMQMKRFNWVRTTDGPKTIVAARAETDALDLNLSGEYGIGLGGRLELRYVRLADGARTSVPVIVQPDGQWTPSL
ncbi:MAG: AsmA family protein [Leptospirales bacterium]|nr:AsmA family protein [Leptospirales bacterium]